MNDTKVDVSMSATLDVIPGRPFKGEAKAMGIKSTEDDINLLIELNEPDLATLALLKIARARQNDPRWAIIAEHLTKTDEALQELNKPSR
jgi:hypothetical protein